MINQKKEIKVRIKTKMLHVLSVKPFDYYILIYQIIKKYSN